MTRWLWLVIFASVLGGCKERGWFASSEVTGEPDSGRGLGALEDAGADAALGPPLPTATPRRGMAWIPPGALVAGTARDLRPRIADQEMPGEQVVLKGFYIDLYPYPNEEGAIPRTNVTQADAQTLCEEQEKRLCTELEWERACKGPDNRRYEYGDRYQASRCDTGRTLRLVPSGLNAGCVSEFGVHDLHGSVWEWTGSPWGRGDTTGLVTVRGGNGVAGELVSRCAHGQPRRPNEPGALIGFRCCSGPENSAKVTLNVMRGKKLEQRETVDKKLVAELLAAAPAETREQIEHVESFHWYRLWTWRPIGNEELVIAAGCAHMTTRPTCGVILGQPEPERSLPVTWISSGMFVPLLRTDLDARDIWVTGGDMSGQFRIALSYRSGEILVGPRERRISKADRRRARRR